MDGKKEMSEVVPDGSQSQRMSRRRFLEVLGLTIAGSATGAAVIAENKNGQKKDEISSATPVYLRPTGNLISFNTEIELSLAARNIQHTPDLPGNLGGLRSHNLPEVRFSFGYDRAIPYRNGYSAIASVLQTDQQNPYHLFGLTHNEQRASGGPGNSFDDDKFTASIGLIESYDGGLTWKDKGPVIVGDEVLPPGKQVSGAGQPSAIIKDGYAYVYYVDWAAQQQVNHPDQIYLARTKIHSDGSLDKFEHYTKEDFSFGSYNNLQPVIPVPDHLPNASYAALPSVSFNEYLRKYLCVFETNVGFCLAESENAVVWGEASLIARFPQPQSARKFGDTWYSYPSLLSDQQQANDQVTNAEGMLYCSKGKWQQSPHNLVGLPFKLHVK